MTTRLASHARRRDVSAGTCGPSSRTDWPGKSGSASTGASTWTTTWYRSPGASGSMPWWSAVSASRPSASACCCAMVIVSPEKSPDVSYETPPLSRRLFDQHDVVAQAFEATDVVTADPFGILAIKVVGTEIAMRNTVLQHVPQRDDHRVLHCHDRFLGTTPCSEPVVERAVVTLLAADRRPCGFLQGRTQPRSPLARRRGSAFPRALVIARTQSRPRGEVRRRGELAHVDARFGDDRLCGTRGDAGHALHERRRFGERGHRLRDPGIERGDMNVQRIDQGQMLLEQHLSLIDALDVHIATLDARIAEAMAPFAEAATLVQSMPGIAARAAQAIIAETGIDMSQFPTAAHFASWARLCPGNNESAGKRRPTTTGKGATWLRATLQEAAWAAVKSKKSYYRALFHRLKARRGGPEKAIVAVQHAMLVALWHMLKHRVPHQDLGADYFTRRDTERTRRHHVRRLEKLGYQVLLVKEEAA